MGVVGALADPSYATYNGSALHTCHSCLIPPAMLDYVKMILLKVSFSKKLFEKELRKALQHILPEDLPDFKTWCYEQFARIYRRVLKRVFIQHSSLPRLAG
jgi:hypothetical protein